MAKDRIWGIERYPLSDLFEQLVCPIINLWDSTLRTHVVGRVPHGEEVEVEGEQVGPDGRDYYFVQAKDGTVGWVSAPFLLGAGG